MGTVFITQDSEGRDFLPADEYGDLQIILESNAQVVLTAKPVIRKLKHALRNFTDQDYLLLSGDPIIMGVAVAVVLDKNMGRANLLKWDRRMKKYYQVSVDMGINNVDR